MPSQTHAVLVDLFRSAPSLAFDLLSATGIAVPAADLRILDSTFPVTTPDYHVDFAVGCYDVVRYHLGAALDRALEAIMATSERPYLSDFANDYYAKGRAAGEAAHARAALLTVIGARAILLGDDDRARIDACTDIGTLDAWLGRAARAAAVAEIFAD